MSSIRLKNSILLIFMEQFVFQSLSKASADQPVYFYHKHFNTSAPIIVEKDGRDMRAKQTVVGVNANQTDFVSLLSKPKKKANGTIYYFHFDVYWLKNLVL